MVLRTVLLVEDSLDEAQMLERALRSTISRSSVVHVTSTSDAESYLFAGDGASAKSKSFVDLVVLDVKVPPSGGLDLLRKVRANGNTRRIPVVMLSAQMPDEDVQDLYRSGVNSYLDKPIDADEFTSMVIAAARYWLSLNMSPRRGC